MAVKSKFDISLTNGKNVCGVLGDVNNAGAGAPIKPAAFTAFIFDCNLLNSCCPEYVAISPNLFMYGYCTAMVFHWLLTAEVRERHELDIVPNKPLTACCGIVLRLVGFT